MSIMKTLKWTLAIIFPYFKIYGRYLVQLNPIEFCSFKKKLTDCPRLKNYFFPFKSLKLWMNCFSTWLGKSLDMKPWLLGVGAGMAARGRWETEPSPCSRSSFALGAAWLWNFQWHTLSVVQDFKSPSFLAARFWGHLIAFSHFTDEEMRPRSVKSISLQFSQLTRDRRECKSILHCLLTFLEAGLMLKFKMPSVFACTFPIGKTTSV